MTWQFIIGFSAGIIAAIFFILSDFIKYQKKQQQAQFNIDRLEQFNSDLQFQIRQTLGDNSSMNNLSY